MKAAAAPPNDRKSEKEDSDDCEIIEKKERKAPRRIVASKSRATDQVVVYFLNATRQFTDTLEDMRREELIQSRGKASRKSLDFEDLQAPSRVHRQETTPPRMPVEMSCMYNAIVQDSAILYRQCSDRDIHAKNGAGRWVAFL